MGAPFVAGFGVGEVERVGVAAAAHRRVGPFPVGAIGDDSKYSPGGDALGFVPGKGSDQRAVLPRVVDYLAI